MDINLKYLIVGTILWAIFGVVVKLVVKYLEIPADIAKLIYIVLTVIFLLWLLSAFGVFGGSFIVHVG